jgi:hypothetical protein
MSIGPTFDSRSEIRAFCEYVIRSLVGEIHSGCATKRVAPWLSSAMKAFAARFGRDLDACRTLT